MRHAVKKLLQISRDLGGRTAIRVVNRGMRKAAAFTHFIQYAIEWGHTEPVPGWFDHYIDQY